MLEKLKKEKEEMNRLRNINFQTLEKTKTFQPKPLNPTPLTLIKPFNLSTNNSKMLMKKRIGGNIEEINSKIAETMKRKCEEVGEKVKETVFIGDTIKMQKTPPNVKYMRRTPGRSRSKSPCRFNTQMDDDMYSLSSRIEKYCIISGTNKNYHNVGNKSPLKLCFSSNNNQNEEKIMDTHINSIMLNTPRSPSTSIRRHFNHANTISTEDKIAKEMQTYKFKAKPLNKNMFSNANAGLPSNIPKKKPEIESFEMILQKTRMEKQMIDKKEKEDKKLNKMNLIKQGKAGIRANKENFNYGNVNGSVKNYSTGRRSKHLSMFIEN